MSLHGNSLGPPHDTAHLPGPLGERRNPKSLHAGRVRCSAWFGVLCYPKRVEGGFACAACLRAPAEWGSFTSRIPDHTRGGDGAGVSGGRIALIRGGRVDPSAGSLIRASGGASRRGAARVREAAGGRGTAGMGVTAARAACGGGAIVLDIPGGAHGGVAHVKGTVGVHWDGRQSRQQRGKELLGQGPFET